MDMRGKSLLTLEGLTDAELGALLGLAIKLKRKKQTGVPGNLLRQKNIALLFEKPSTRTRCAVTVAAVDEGAGAEHLGARDIHLGKKESVVDTARVLGRMFDGIMFRGFKQRTVEMLAEHAGVPVWNGLTDAWHPTQVLADLMTVNEEFRHEKDLKFVYVGDGRNNVASSLTIGCAKTGIDFVNCTPAELSPDTAIVKRASSIAAAHGSTIKISHDPCTAVKGANVVYTDVWASMGEEASFSERMALLQPYQVNMELMRKTGNIDSGNVIFLHCLPAFHDSNTEFSRDHGALEVTDDVFEAGFSRVFIEAENRVHTIKALMVATVGDLKLEAEAGGNGAEE